MVGKSFPRYLLRGSRWPLICAVLVFGLISVMALAGLLSLTVYAQSQSGQVITDPTQLAAGEILRLTGGEINQIAFSPHDASASSGTAAPMAVAATSAGLWSINLTPGITVGNSSQLLDSAAITTVWWAPNAHLLAAETYTGTVQIWQTTETTVKVSAIQSSTNKIVTAAWSPDSLQLATGKQDGSVEIWNTNAQLQDTKIGHTAPINSLSWSQDGTMLLSSAKDGSVRAWTVQTLTNTNSVSPTATLSPTGFISPTNQPPSAATPTATSVPIQAIIQTDALNIRSGPGTTYTKIGSAKLNDQLNVIGQVNACVWLKVQTPSNDQGWIAGSAQFVTLSAACDLIPTATLTSTTGVTSTTATPPTAATSAPTGTAALPANQGCYLFQNQLGVELNITVTRSDNNQSTVYSVANGQETPACLDPGHYTYTVDAPPPWASINGQLDVTAGARFLIPVRAQ
ncbi:MAG: SH3 domain-containing protein [Chloroflexi bacterium]|nr:SH3 domain-containing protein [Chloroflexota bacterium]